jgi:5'-nucleotidase/UDP-sugar diphosphatase
MRALRLSLLVLLVASGRLMTAATTVTLVHFSDYHSHAVPFWTEDGERGGIARAITLMKDAKREGALVFSGGDMINKGAPAWSDRYGCAEWPWLNGIVDAMAFGNHEPDYGRAAFDACAEKLRYPILSANVAGFDAYRVFERAGIRIGVFAVAGDDFEKLGVRGKLGDAVPPFGDPIAAARETVRVLREQENADVVVMIGHEHAAADAKLAREVPGIDLIFGSHGHLKQDLGRIEGTGTWFVSPFQYLTYLSRVTLTIDGGRVTTVSGGLVSVTDAVKADPAIARRVSAMQRALELDPQYRDLFEVIGHLQAPLPLRQLAQKTLDAMRSATGSDVALSTTSSFRGALPAGPLTPELLQAVLPYDNEIVVCTMAGAQLQKVLAESEARGGSDSAAFVSGPAELDPAGSYKVATTDYLANVAYRDVFDCAREKSGLRVRAELRKALTR